MICPGSASRIVAAPTITSRPSPTMSPPTRVASSASVSASGVPSPQAAHPPPKPGDNRGRKKQECTRNPGAWARATGFTNLWGVQKTVRRRVGVRPGLGISGQRLRVGWHVPEPLAKGVAGVPINVAERGGFEVDLLRGLRKAGQTPWHFRHALRQRLRACHPTRSYTRFGPLQRPNAKLLIGRLDHVGVDLLEIASRHRPPAPARPVARRGGVCRRCSRAGGRWPAR